MTDKDESILIRIKEGDKNALKYLYKEYQSSAKSLILRMGGVEDDIEDLFVEAMMTLYENIIVGKFTGKSSLRTYFLALIKYKYLDSLRKKKPALEHDAYKSLVIPKEEELIELERKQELNKLLKEALNQLSGNCKEILEQYYFEQKPLKEIAEESGLTVQSLKNRTYRCRKRLSDLIKSNPKFEEYIKSKI